GRPGLLHLDPSDRQLGARLPPQLRRSVGSVGGRGIPAVGRDRERGTRGEHGRAHPHPVTRSVPGTARPGVRAVPRPNPRLAPVITAVRPQRSGMVTDFRVDPELSRNGRTGETCGQPSGTSCTRTVSPATTVNARARSWRCWEPTTDHRTWCGSP